MLTAAAAGVGHLLTSVGSQLPRLTHVENRDLVSYSADVISSRCSAASAGIGAAILTMGLSAGLYRRCTMPGARSRKLHSSQKGVGRAMATLLAHDGVREVPPRHRGDETEWWELQTDVQTTASPLPSGLSTGVAPQRFELSAEQVARFEEDGVILIPGGCKHWGEFLATVTDKQVEHPHLWSFEGRIYGQYYDYFQRNLWTTNDGYRDFYYYSPLGHIMAQLGRTEEVRISTDVLMVNPRKGFGWHQDCQNGPIALPDALRWWVCIDACGDDGFGAPQFLLGSHKNTTVAPEEDQFLDLEVGDLSRFAERRTNYVVQPGDVIVWHPRTIHRIVSRPGGMARSAFGGSVALSGAKYIQKSGRATTSDYLGHSLQSGGLLEGPYFPRIYPDRVPEEEACRDSRSVWREPRNLFQTALSLIGRVPLAFAQFVPKPLKD